MATDQQNETPKTKSNTEHLYDWQNRLIWWMTIVPTFLIIVFIILATLQLNRFNKEINSYKDSELEPVYMSYGEGKTISYQDNADYIRFYTLAKMEDMSMRKRYSQAGVLLMSRVLTKYFGFFTGMILAIVGAVFIISKLQEEPSDIEGSVSDNIKLKIASASPGVIFGVLGTVLMLATILQHSEINVKDMPLYLNAGNLAIPSISQPYNRLDSANIPNFETHTDTGKAKPDSGTTRIATDEEMRAARP
ncbi:hypothetical protein OCK74_12415 [Chitinophagaceae bacterium LB-8]|uniref:Uncharacterized protein n=1 Tax=Paraflavisolibacter caeni TaxID=2982496 RepID=A0A9X2XWH6_9BACT|nr:hypothetical protein [Paraflavisolibacter caeni]MCU7549927.1 hypothetical protein [Paraflavisolibacter caeni]